MGFNSAFKGLNVAVPTLKMIHVKDVQKSATTPEII